MGLSFDPAQRLLCIAGPNTVRDSYGSAFKRITSLGCLAVRQHCLRHPASFCA